MYYREFGNSTVNILLDTYALHPYNVGMIRSNLAELKLAKERERGHKITYDMMKAGANVSQNAIARLISLKPIERIDGKTLNGLCRYFGCQVGDILVFVEDNGNGSQ